MTKIYRWIVDHLTKTLATLGATFMSLVAFIDPAAVREAAQTYLGDRWVAKVGIALFVLVFFRGWYTGYKAKQAAEALATAQAALPQPTVAIQPTSVSIVAPPTP